MGIIDNIKDDVKCCSQTHAHLMQQIYQIATYDAVKRCFVGNSYGYASFILNTQTAIKIPIVVVLFVVGFLVRG